MHSSTPLDVRRELHHRELDQVRREKMEEEAMKEEYRMRAEESEQHIQELLEKVCVCVCVCVRACVHCPWLLAADAGAGSATGGAVNDGGSARGDEAFGGEGGECRVEGGGR